MAAVKVMINVPLAAIEKVPHAGWALPTVGVGDVNVPPLMPSVLTKVKPLASVSVTMTPLVALFVVFSTSMT